MTSWSLRVTADGSHTVFSEPYQSTYHSMHGAWQESMHVFIQAGLFYVLENHEYPRIRIWEMGFGTGLNAFLSWLVLQERPVHLDYLAIDLNPLPPSITNQLNYPKLCKHPHAVRTFDAIHRAAWGQPFEIGPHFTLTKIQTDLSHYHPEGAVDLIYFDAFGPGCQANLWSKQVVQEQILPLCQKGTILTTYSAQGLFRRNLQSTGFLVTKIPGPPGKREMIRAQFLGKQDQ